VIVVAAAADIAAVATEATVAVTATEDSSKINFVLAYNGGVI
jgi:hypothetical protein